LKQLQAKVVIDHENTLEKDVISEDSLCPDLISYKQQLIYNKS